jgi:hypothetical protein
MELRMKQLRAFVLRRIFVLNCIILANLTVSPKANAQDLYTHWICNAVRSMPGMPVGTTTGMPGHKENNIWLDYYEHLANGETKVFGNLVPYDKVWLTDDAMAPIFRTKYDIMVGGLLVPAGSYSLYFLPSVRGWKLIVNKQVGQAGNVYDASQDLGRVNMVQATAAGCEILTLDFRPVPGKECSGRCNPEGGPFVPRDIFGKPLLHLAWAEANFYVVLRSPIGADTPEDAFASSE